MQNFLGARWVSHDIACNEIQSQFGGTIDTSLAHGLRQFRNLLGTRGGRGGEGPDIKNVEDTSGNKYHMRPGGVPFLAEPLIETQELDDGSHVIRATLGDFKQLGWAVAKMQTQLPNSRFDIGEIKNNLKPSNDYLTDPLELTAGIGGRDYFRGLLKAAFNLVAANSTEVALLRCFDALRSFIVDGNGRDADHVRWIATADPLPFPQLGLFDHFIAVYSRGESVEGVVQFFGGISHLVRLTDSYDGLFCFQEILQNRCSEPISVAQIRLLARILQRFPRTFLLFEYRIRLRRCDMCRHRHKPVYRRERHPERL